MNDPASNFNDLPAVLGEIVDFKLEEIVSAKLAEPITVLEGMIAAAPPTRDFFGALVDPNEQHTRVIAEIKRQSPSAGLIRPEYELDGFKPEIIAQQYSNAGASAISCLTDEKFFGGHLSFINRIKAIVDLPVIRKDFILDPYQIIQARAHGADAVLLIAECLTNAQITEMLELADSLGLSVLLEVHSKVNLLRVQPILNGSTNKRVLLGINNRDLTRMVTDLAHTTDLVELVDDRSILVSESGIKAPADLARLRDHGVHIALIGEHFMRQPNPGDTLKAMLE
ncbi:MAG: indole-3-glycerol-phosphate synthase [Phycisphaerales bacterium]|nr:indole-3-glycerol-phosphate synthase [Phycisphaerales bacterium]